MGNGQLEISPRYFDLEINSIFRCDSYLLAGCSTTEFWEVRNPGDILHPK